MRIKIIIVVLIIVGIFTYIWKSNNADKERLARAEITHQQKMENEKQDTIEQKAQMELAAIKQKEDAQKAEQDNQKAQIEISTIKVKESLLDPSSAQFKNQKGYCGEVNAKNRMGGYIGFSRYVYEPKSQYLFLESSSKDSLVTPELMNDLWSKNCT